MFLDTLICCDDVILQVKDKEAELKSAEQKLHDEFERLRRQNAEEKRQLDDKKRQLVRSFACHACTSDDDDGPRGFSGGRDQLVQQEESGSASSASADGERAIGLQKTSPQKMKWGRFLVCVMTIIRTPAPSIVVERKEYWLCTVDIILIFSP